MMETFRHATVRAYLLSFRVSMDRPGAATVGLLLQAVVRVLASDSVWASIDA